KSILEHLGTPEFPRFKVGIGHPAGERKAVIKHVLQRFYADEAEFVADAVRRTADAVEDWLQVGLEKVMQKHNKK
ncbi:MAG: aminoacyl-tRNA hydrolase, partial [Acidaminococcaceae bacterium]